MLVTGPLSHPRQFNEDMTPGSGTERSMMTFF